MVREAWGTISGIEGSDDPLKTGHVICGNEYVHGELVKILKPLDKYGAPERRTQTMASSTRQLA